MCRHPGQVSQREELRANRACDLLQDLLKPAPPAPPILLPASPMPAPIPAPPAQVDTGQPKVGRKDGQDSCEQQGMQGECK